MAEEPKKLNEIKEGEAAATKAEAEKPKDQAAVAESSDDATKTSAPETNNESEADAVAPTEKPPEKKKRFGLPFFKGKKKESKSDEASVEPPKEPLTPEELVNTIDGEIKIHAETKQARLAAVMNNQIQAPKSNHITIKLKIRQLLLLSGIVVITTWLVVLISLVYDYALAQGFDFKTIFNRNNQPSETETLPLEESMRQVRIRDASQGSSEVTDLANSLEANFGITYVEIVEDTEFEDETITLYARPDAYQLLLELIDGLGSTYAVASGSAQLSEDSDFGIVITFPATDSSAVETEAQTTSQSE